MDIEFECDGSDYVADVDLYSCPVRYGEDLDGNRGLTLNTHDYILNAVYVWHSDSFYPVDKERFRAIIDNLMEVGYGL